MTTLLDRRPARAARAVGVSSAFGTFGELMQGRLPDGADLLVTLPVARWSTATFTAEPDAPGIRLDPAHKAKALRLARGMLCAAGYPGGGTLRVDSCLPEGKGMASSSADLVATARAVANALHRPLTPAAVAGLLRSIEPTDGVMYDGLVAFHHRRVSLRARLGAAPPMTVVALDEGGRLDTVAFNRRPKPFGPAECREYARMLDRLAVAVPAGDLATLGAVATRSAELNQALAPKRTFEPLRRAAADIGALGVVVAHSGTVAGLLLDDADPDHPARRAAAERVCRDLTGASAVHHVLSFGRF